MKRYTTLQTAVLMTALLCLSTGCDSSTAMEEDEDPVPVVQNARIDLNLQEIQVVSKCEGGTNPGEWQFLIDFVDEGNTPLAQALNLPQGTTYGTFTGQATEVITTNDNNRINLGQSFSFERPREEGTAFSVLLSAYEWDAANTPDPDMDNRSVNRTHTFQSGRFTNVIGTNELRLRTGSGNRCEAVLRYTVTVQ